MKTCIIYTRVSSADQVQGTSLETQEHDIRAWCERNGYVVLEHFQDAGESAKTAKRPGLIKAITTAKSKKAGAFIVYRFSRFTRSLEDAIILCKHLKEHGCKLISISEPIPEGFIGKMSQYMSFIIPEIENDIRGDTSKRGLEATVAKGGWCWVPPFGYVAARNADRLPILRPDGKLSVVIAKALRGVLNKTMAKVDAAELMMKAGMSRTCAFRVFEMPVYGGIIRSKLAPSGIRAAFDGIISTEEWYALEGLLNRPAERAVRNYENDTFPLTTILVCPVCGKSLAAGLAQGKKKRYPYYWCKKKHITIRAEKVHEQLAVLLDSSPKLQADLDAALQTVAERLIVEMKEASAHRSKIQEQMTKNDARIKKLALAYASGDLPDEVCKTALAEIRQQQAELQLKLFEHRSPDDFIELLSHAKTALKRLSFAYSALPTRGKKDLLKLLFGTLTLSADKQKVEPPKECVFTTLFEGSAGLVPNGRTVGI